MVTITVPGSHVEPKRDRWGRPQVVSPDGGKPVSYTRATTIAKTIEDQHSLIAWRARVTAKGLTIRSELLSMIAVTDDRQRLDELCEQAAEAGGAAERREKGTALHEALRRHFTGAPVPPMFAADVAAVDQLLAAHQLEPMPDMTERFCVLDEHRIAGSFDLILTRGGQRRIADIKTGASLDYSGLAFATQLAIYANADALYDPANDTRHPMPDIDRSLAYIIHVQPGSGVAALHTVDITYGRRALDLCLEVRRARNEGRRLITQCETPTQPTSGPAGAEVCDPRRDNLARRCSALRQHPGAAETLAAAWPAGIPGFKAEHRHRPDELDAIEAELERVERQHMAPFDPPPPPDEGPDMAPADIEALKRRVDALEGTARAYFAAVARQAEEAKRSISLRVIPSTRRFAIVRALVWWADYDDDIVRCALGVVMGRQMQPAFSTGNAFGSLTTDEANRLTDLAGAIGAGLVRLGFTDDGPVLAGDLAAYRRPETNNTGDTTP
jgi:hypothetical protein